MSTTEALTSDVDLRIAVRRAALRQALRTGRGLEIVRAAERMRLDSASLGGRALLEVRDTRGRLGRAMRVARRRRLLGDQEAAQAAVAIPAAAQSRARRLRRRWIVAGIVALLIVGLALLWLLWPREPEIEPGGGLPPLQQVEQVVRREVLRGRSVVLPNLPPIVVASAPPTLAPSPSPTREPDEGHQGGGSGAGVPGGTGAGTGGSGTGTGSGVGSGSGPGTPRPTPRPTQPPPGPLQPGFGRFTVVVVDAVSGALLPDVCLIVGSGDCAPGKPHTDGAGRWTVDVPLNTPTTNWDVKFIYAGYQSDYRRFVLLQGQTVTYVVRLQPFQGRD